MKKIMVGIAILMIILVQNKINNNSDLEVIIPDDSIRIRIIANSNSVQDQYEKLVVKNKIQIELQELLKDTKTKQEAENIINANLNHLDNLVQESLNTIGSKTRYTINYGDMLFPTKEFKGYTYDEGYYEALVITLGSGTGDNWWCVLFPPLCLMETDEANMSNVEYKLFLNEVISKYK